MTTETHTDYSFDAPPFVKKHRSIANPRQNINNNSNFDPVLYKNEDERPWLILHVGPPKTATTTLQHSLEKLGVKLATHDNYYYMGQTLITTKYLPLDQNTTAITTKHNGVTKYLKDTEAVTIYTITDFIYKQHPSRPFTQTLLHHYNSNHNVILSSEFFTTHLQKKPNYWTRILEDIFLQHWHPRKNRHATTTNDIGGGGDDNDTTTTKDASDDDDTDTFGFRIKIIVGYRHFYEWLPSYYAQRYKYVSNKIPDQTTKLLQPRNNKRKKRKKKRVDNEIDDDSEDDNSYDNDVDPVWYRYKGKMPSLLEYMEWYLEDLVQYEHEPQLSDRSAAGAGTANTNNLKYTSYDGIFVKHDNWIRTQKKVHPSIWSYLVWSESSHPKLNDNVHVFDMHQQRYKHHQSTMNNPGNADDDDDEEEEEEQNLVANFVCQMIPPASAPTNNNNNNNNSTCRYLEEETNDSHFRKRSRTKTKGISINSNSSVTTTTTNNNNNNNTMNLLSAHDVMRIQQRYRELLHSQLATSILDNSNNSINVQFQLFQNNVTSSLSSEEPGNLQIMLWIKQWYKKKNEITDYSYTASATDTDTDTDTDTNDSHGAYNNNRITLYGLKRCANDKLRNKLKVVSWNYLSQQILLVRMHNTSRRRRQRKQQNNSMIKNNTAAARRKSENYLVLSSEFNQHLYNDDIDDDTDDDLYTSLLVDIKRKHDDAFDEYVATGALCVIDVDALYSNYEFSKDVIFVLRGKKRKQKTTSEATTEETGAETAETKKNKDTKNHQYKKEEETKTKQEIQLLN